MKRGDVRSGEIGKVDVLEGYVFQRGWKRKSDRRRKCEERNYGVNVWV